MKIIIKNVSLALFAWLFHSAAFVMEAKEEAGEQYVGHLQTFRHIKTLKDTLTGRLCLAENEDKESFAIKIAKMRHGRQVSENPAQELATLLYLCRNPENYPNQLIKLEDCGEYRDPSHIWMAFPFVEGGDALEFLVQRKFLPIHEARSLFCDLALGLEYLHKNGVAHLDISLENCLISVNKQTGKNALIITDFGLAQITQGAVRSALCSRPGKQRNMAPEILACAVEYDPLAADIWSAGICLYNLATAQILVEEASARSPRYRYLQDLGLRAFIGTLGLSLAHTPPEDCVVLLENMLHCDPSDRFAIQEVLESAFVQAELECRLMPLSKQ